MTFPYKLIDLTHDLQPDMPTWSGRCGFDHILHMDYDDFAEPDKFRVMKLKMHAGIGTHMDAPRHCVPHGACVDQFDLNELIFPCVVIDVKEKCHERYAVSMDDILAFEEIHGKIPSGSCVLIQTGWSQFWQQPNMYHNNHVFPSISKEAAAFLLDRGVQALGIDTLSPDSPHNGFPVHQLFLSNGKILIENVAHLEKMPATGAFVFIAPLKIKDGTEAPIRLIAMIKKESL
ncbi:MAG: Isatin hydrolase [Holosporales bacterium]